MRRKIIGLLLAATMVIALGFNVYATEFSLADLYATQAAINEIIEERFVPLVERRGHDAWCVYANNFSSSTVCEESGRVIVSLVEYNEDMIAGFRAYVYDSPMVVFIPGDGYASEGQRTANATIVAIIILAGIFLFMYMKAKRKMTRL